MKRGSRTFRRERRPAKRVALWGLAALCWAATALAGGTLRVAEDKLPRGINPLYGEHLVDLRVGSLLFSGLYTEDRFNRTTPVLAAALTPDPADPRVVEVQLRPGLRWHDGEPVTADDVRFTFETLRDPKRDTPLAAQVRAISAIVPRGRDRVAITFQTAPRDPARLLTFPILPAHLFTGTAPSRSHPFRLRPIGTGPYRLERYDTDGTIGLSRNPYFPLGRPAIPEIELREIRDKQIQIEALRFGNLEVVVRVLPRDLPDLEHVRRVELRPYQTNSWWYLGFNLKREPWSVPGVRQALAELIDVDRLLEPLGTGERISGPFVPSSPFYNHRANIPLTRPDPADAGRRLAQAGYLRDARGQLQRRGVPLRIDLAIEKDLPVAREVAVNLEGQLRRAGIQVTLTWLDAAGWDQRVVREHAFDLTLSQWSFDRGEDIYDQFHSRGAQNYVGFRDPAVDRLLERARAEIDPEVRRQSNQEVHRLLAASRPYLFLWTLTQYAAFSAEVRDVAIDPFTFFSQVHRWTLGPRGSEATTSRREP
jgi:peptide/nickel transport system substrate-binding protein